MSSPDAGRRVPHADLWVLGLIAFLSRLHWILALHYHSDPLAPSSVPVTIFFSLLLVALGYAFACIVKPRVFAYAARAALLAMFLFHLAVQLRQLLVPVLRLEVSWQLEIAAVGLTLAGLGAAWLVPVWSRLRTALLAAAIIESTSVFALVAILAPDVELLADGASRHRPVVVLLLDEVSAGSAQGLASALAGRQLQVESYPVPSMGRNTIDAIPAIFTRVALPGARACTGTAVCGSSRAVDFARLSVGRPDVDIVGAYHHYCAIHGLRHCVIPQYAPEMALWKSFVCALPLRLVMGAGLGCRRPGFADSNFDGLAAPERELARAPFWTQGGMLYVHLLTPHPPSPSGEVRLADAYSANLRRAQELVMRVVDRLENAPFRDDYTLVVISDHHLRSEEWCKTEPYESHDCSLPAPMRTAEVPFIIATRGAAVVHAVPRSNIDLFPIVVELSRAR